MKPGAFCNKYYSCISIKLKQLDNVLNCISYNKIEVIKSLGMNKSTEVIKTDILSPSPGFSAHCESQTHHSVEPGAFKLLPLRPY